MVSSREAAAHSPTAFARAAWWLAALALVLGGYGIIYTNWEMLAGSGEPSIEGVDDTGYYIWLRSGVIDGDFDFTNDLTVAPTLRDEVRELWLAEPRTELGRVPNKYPPGWALVTLPAFIAGHFVALASGAMADGWSPPYFVAIWIYHLALSLVGLWCAWKVVARFAPRPIAAMAVLAVWIASPLIYYQTSRVGMVHGLLFTLIALVYHLTFAVRENPAAVWRWPLLGLTCGLVALVRAPAVAYLLFPAMALLTELRRLRGPARATAIAGLIGPCLAAVVLLAGATWTLHGTLWTTPYPGEPFYFGRPHLFGVLFSPLHGLFYWHPLLLVGMAGAVRAAWRREVPRAWIASFLVVTYINASWHIWWFGSSFGSRAFEGSVLFAMAGLAWMFGRPGVFARWRGVPGYFTAASVVAGGCLFVLFLTQSIPRDRPVTYIDMITATARPLLDLIDPGAVE